MTTYNTQNPVPSVDVRDLYDNAQNLDSLVNGQSAAYPDRLGVSRKSYKGMELDFSAFLAASGFELPALEYVDGTPLVVDRPTQLILRDGILYGVKANEPFPAALIGTFATDQAKLVVRSDSDLRQDLANDTDPAKGAALVYNRSVLNSPFNTPNDQSASATAGIQAAIDAGPGIVRIPAGQYLLTSQLNMRSGVTVQCDPGAVLWAEGFGSIAVEYSGVVEAEFALTASAGIGSTELSVDAASEYSAGDVLHLVSVRNSLSSDAGSYRLGDGTAGSPYAYFAEWAEVSEVLGAGQYRISRTLAFPGYAPTAAAETDTARTASTVKRVQPVRDAHWIGGTIMRRATAGRCVSTNWAVDCTIRETQIHSGRRGGDAVRFMASWQCYADGVVSHNDPTLEWDYATYHGSLNRFKIVGSQDCGFRNIRDSFASQSVDFTYGTGALFANLRPYCIGGEFLRCFEGLTSHPGSYQELWDSNRILDCLDDGLTIRGYAPVIRNNTIIGTLDTTTGVGVTESFGVSLQYGGPRRAQVSGNTIRGLYGAFQVLSSSTLEWGWTNALVSISGNEVSHCYTGLRTSFSSGSVNDSERFITYAGNNHSFMGRFVVELGSYSAGVTVIGNTLNGGFRDSGAAFVAFLSATTNCPGITMQGNVWRRVKGANPGQTKYGCTVGSIVDTTTYPSADWQHTTRIDGNYIAHERADGVIHKLVGVGAGIQQEDATFGTYTPTLTNVTNVSASTAGECQFQRAGNVITVSGALTGVQSTAAATTSRIRLSLPMPTTLPGTSAAAGAGVFSSGASLGTACAMYGNTANNAIDIDWLAPNNTASQAIRFSFTYRVV